MKTLILNRVFDGVDFLGEEELLAYRWEPENIELVGKFSYRQLFKTEQAAIGHDSQARNSLLNMLNENTIEWE